MQGNTFPLTQTALCLPFGTQLTANNKDFTNDWQHGNPHCAELLWFFFFFPDNSIWTCYGIVDLLPNTDDPTDVNNKQE